MVLSYRNRRQRVRGILRSRDYRTKGIGSGCRRGAELLQGRQQCIHRIDRARRGGPLIFMAKGRCAVFQLQGYIQSCPRILHCNNKLYGRRFAIREDIRDYRTGRIGGFDLAVKYYPNKLRRRGQRVYKYRSYGRDYRV